VSHTTSEEVRSVVDRPNARSRDGPELPESRSPNDSAPVVYLFVPLRAVISRGMEGEEDAFDTGPPPSDEECEVPISYDQAPAGAEAAEEEAVAVAEAAVPEKSLAEVRADFESLFGRYWRGRGCAQPPAVHVTWWRNDPGIYWHLWFAVQVRAVWLCCACATRLTLFTTPPNHHPQRHGGYDVVTAQKLWRTSADSMQRTPPRASTHLVRTPHASRMPPPSGECTTISYQIKLAYETCVRPRRVCDRA